MIYFNQRQAIPALAVVLGLMASAIAPLTISAPATANSSYTVAQLFPSQQPRKLTIPAGTNLPVRYDKADKIIVSPTETLPLTLTIARNIRSSSGALLIPAGSQVKGNLKPIDGGSQFVADSLTFPDGTVMPLDATSNVIKTTQEIRPGVNTDAVLKGAAIGAGAAAIISGILGNRHITLGKILIGGAAGAVGGLIFGKQKADVIVINSNSDLTLTLNSPLTLRPVSSPSTTGSGH
jgi:hypothetical protein